MSSSTSVAVIVAHPDDETLWAGGTILSHPEWECYIAALCRGSDPDRSPKFHRALRQMGASGDMADLDDGAEQTPLPSAVVEGAVLSLLADNEFDLAVTHGPWGEYTRHRRHEEASSAVTGLWTAGRILADNLWLFAYEDGGGQYLPRPRRDAHRIERLDTETWTRKYSIITETYGFAPDSLEARTTPTEEAFWCFKSARELNAWLQRRRCEGP
jgi:LmbE family N-acetylglucosaminyl deacetylase